MDKSLFEGKKVMISQPMRGKTTEQIKNERAVYVEAITDFGGEVIDTVFTPLSESAQHASVYFLGKAIEAMSKSDVIIFMPGWESARGCMIEHIIATSYGIPVLELSDIENEGTKMTIKREYAADSKFSKVDALITTPILVPDIPPEFAIIPKGMFNRMRYEVWKYVIDHLDKSDNIEFPFNDESVYTVWTCKTLQNWKALISTNLPDGMYYECTYNGDTQEMYLDAYKKFENKTIKIDQSST